MPNLSFENLSNNEQSLNFSVYKPEGISSFWNWFTRKNKTGDLPKTMFENSCRLKLDENTLTMLKKNGIDLEKIHIPSRSKKKFLNQSKMLFLPKTSLKSKEKDIINDFVFQNIMKQTSFTNSTKAFEHQFKSSSTLSIKSNSGLKYIHNRKSQRSVHSVSSPKAWSAAGNPRNVLLKSVPPAVLKSNLQKKVFLPIYIGKRKSDKENRLLKNQKSNNIVSQTLDKDCSDMMPMLLTKIKSMEDQISNIGITTKKINDVVSQQQILGSSREKNEPGNKINAEKSTGVENKSSATHKVNSKNINPSAKKSKTQPKKLRNKKKLNYASGNSSKSVRKYKHLKVKTVNNNCDKKKLIKGKISSSFLNNSEKFIELHNFAIPNNISKDNLFQANSNIGCDIMLQLLKALSEVSYSMKNTQSVSSNHEHLNLRNESKFVSPCTISDFSKPTFDWKHKSLTNMSVTQDKEINKASTGNSSLVINKIGSFPLENTTLTKDSNQVSQNWERLALSDQQKRFPESFDKDVFDRSFEALDKTSNQKQCSEQTYSDLRQELEENMDNIDITSEKMYCNQVTLEKTICLKETEDSEHSVRLAYEKETESQSCKKNLFLSHEKHLNISKASIEHYSNQSLCQAENETYIEQPKSVEKSRNRTTILCSNTRNDPKVSITILVEDSLKNTVNMKSNIAVNVEGATKVYSKQRIIAVNFPDMKRIGGSGDSEDIVKEENPKQNSSLLSLNKMNDLSYTKSAISYSNLSNLNENNVQPYKEDCYCDVNIAKVNVKESDNIVHSSQGAYLNLEKRKVYEEQLFGTKVKNKESINPICTEYNNNSISTRMLSQTCMEDKNLNHSKFKIITNSPFNSGLTLYLNPILEEIEHGSTFPKLNATKPQPEIGDNIKIQDNNDSASSIAQQKNEVPNAIRSVKIIPERKCSSKYIPSDFCPTANPLLSSACVQTDWSLVGITVEHFRSEAVVKTSTESTKISVSTQTEDIERQIVKSEKEKEDNTRLMLNTRSQVNWKCTCNKVSDQLDETGNKLCVDEDTVTEVSTSAYIVNTADTVQNIEKRNNMQTIAVVDSTFKDQTEEFLQNHESLLKYKGDFSVKEMINLHTCSVPCFHPLLEETVVFDTDFRASNNQSSKIIPNKSSASSQIYHFSPHKNSNSCKVLNNKQSIQQTPKNDNTNFVKNQGSKSFYTAKDTQMKPKQSNQMIYEEVQDALPNRTNNGLKCNKIGKLSKASLNDSAVSNSLTSLRDQMTEHLSNHSHNMRNANHMAEYLTGLECGDIDKSKNYIGPFTLGSYL